MRKSILLALVLLAFASTQLWAVGQARLIARVVDPSGKPLPDVKISIDAVEAKTFHATEKTDAKGEARILLLDGTISYRFTFEKEGFGTYQEVIKLRLIPEKNEKTFTLGAPEAGVEAKADPAIVAYNEGIDLINAGKNAEAIAKFEEALAAKPDFGAGYKTLAVAYFRTKNWSKAIEAGTKALELAGDDPELNSILAAAYEETGDKAKSAEYQKKAPATAGMYFNDAAKLINAGKDAEAEPLLKQSIATDEKFAVAYYELGMVYVRLGKPADAKANLQKYLELEPNGKDAGTAKEMLKYIK